MAKAKIWNWQQKGWPNFIYEPATMARAEADFLLHSGMFQGACLHVNAEEKISVTIDLLSDEALKTSEIEGEILNRDSVQSSICRGLGVSTDKRAVKPAEAGIAEMVVDLYRGFQKPLSHECLFSWHKMILNGRRDIESIGKYRKHSEPMKVVSGRIDAPKVHFEAPPSEQVPREMKQYIDWFNRTAPNGKTPLPTLTRAGIAHLFFESIHPFEDGNGRIGRAIVEKVVAQSAGKPSLIALSQTIQTHRKRYYEMLEMSNKTLSIDEWLHYFAHTILKAQETSQSLVEFIIKKAKFYDRFRNLLNPRQSKAIARMFREGIAGFQGGLNAEKYIAITATSRATATRDLQDLVIKEALTKTGVGKGSRYQLKVRD